MEMDPKNESGLRLRALKALLGAGRTDADLMQTAVALDPKNELGLRERVVLAHLQAVDSEDAVRTVCGEIDELVALGPIVDEELALFLYVNAAGWNDRFLSDLEAAKRYARLAKEVAPEEDASLHEMLDAILAKS